MTCALDRQKLDAYVDDSLTREEVAAVEEHLIDCPACAANALGRLQIKRATRAAAANLALSPDFQMRPEFRIRMEKSIQPKQHPLWNHAWLPWLSVAVVALLIIAASAAMLTHRSARNQAIAEALDLHVATIASANPVDVVSTDRHTVKPWFQGKLPFTFNLPELQDSPYKLLGGKLVYLNQSPGAQLLFELRKHEISVFIVQSETGLIPPGANVTATSEKGFCVETWSQGGLRFLAVSDASLSDVHTLGELLRGAGH